MPEHSISSTPYTTLPRRKSLGFVKNAMDLRFFLQLGLGSAILKECTSLKPLQSIGHMMCHVTNTQSRFIDMGHKSDTARATGTTILVLVTELRKHLPN